MKKIYNINIDGDTPLEKRNNPVFQNYFKQVWDEINNEYK